MSKKIVSMLVLVLFSSCSYLKPPPIPNTDFLNDVPSKLIEKDDRAPFQRSWADRRITKKIVGTKGTIIRKVIVSADDLQPSKRKRFDSFEGIKKEAKILAKDFELKIIETLKNYPDKTAEYNENKKINLKTFEIEIKIVELVPQAVARKILSTGFGLFTHIGSIFGLYGDSVIAIEGKLIRSYDKKIVGAFADRHAGKISPIDFRIVSEYHQAKENIREWSNDIAELINTPITHRVKGESVITLYPW